MIHQDLSVVTMAGSPLHRAIHSTEFITIYLKSVYKSYCYKLTGSFKGWILNITPLTGFYSSNKIRKTQNELLNIICQNLNSQ